MEALSKSEYLFVYSSLLKGFQTPEYSYIHKFFESEGPAKVRGILSDMGDYVTGTPVTDERFIQGELYHIENFNQMSFAIGQLDGYEGVNPEEAEQPFYQRRLAEVIKADGTRVTAWVYWYAGDVSGRPVISSGNVWDFVQKRH